MSWSDDIGARTLWQEARGENEEGRRAVAHVINNRLKLGHWGRTVAEVCLWPLQFSGWNVHDPNRLATARLPDNDPTLVTCAQILRNVLIDVDEDLTGGAILYYAPKIVAAPSWVAEVKPCGQFGSQLFFR
jgi:spore germination cell wall hydrolase CwlJ-like protein